MTDKEVIARLNYLKVKAEVALNNTNTSCGWLVKDVKGTVTALTTAIEALEKQKEIEALLEEKMQELYRTSEVYFEISMAKKQSKEVASLDAGISTGMRCGALMIQEVLSKMRGEI